MLGSGMNLITTIIGFGMSATFIVFVCTRLICGRLRRIEERQMFEIDSRIDLELVCLICILGVSQLIHSLSLYPPLVLAWLEHVIWSFSHMILRMLLL